MDFFCILFMFSLLPYSGEIKMSVGFRKNLIMQA